LPFYRKFPEYAYFRTNELLRLYFHKTQPELAPAQKSQGYRIKNKHKLAAIWVNG
jgi:hypothetical protein